MINAAQALGVWVLRCHIPVYVVVLSNATMSATGQIFKW